MNNRKNKSAGVLQAGTTGNLPTSKSDVALARKLAKAFTWESRFDVFLQDDSIARDGFRRILDIGLSRHKVVMLLEMASDRHTGKRLRNLMPIKTDGKSLAKKLRSAAQEIRSFWKPSSLFAFLPDRITPVNLADSLDQQADAIGQIQWGVLTKRVGYKTFWSQLPLASVCQIFRVPEEFSYEEMSRVLQVAVRVHSYPRGQVDLRGWNARAIAQTYNRFLRRNARFIAAGGLDLWIKGLIKILPR